MSGIHSLETLNSICAFSDLRGTGCRATWLHVGLRHTKPYLLALVWFLDQLTKGSFQVLQTYISH
jgi:hypothetical protein